MNNVNNGMECNGQVALNCALTWENYLINGYYIND